jgi:arylsulfatase A-like enzyme
MVYNFINIVPMSSNINLLCLLLIATFTATCMPKETTIKPNVLLIITDDLGWTDLGAYGSSFYETPNLDNLASDGVMFTDGYANCPVCSPSRASFQTGKYAARTGVTDWITGRKSHAGATPNDRWIAADTKFQLDLEETTIAEVLKENGYNTFFAGKWHLGEEEQFWPENRGYDINKGGWSKGAPIRNPKENFNGYFSPYGNPRLADGPEGEYLPDRLATETIDFIKANSDNPYFACLSFYLVHTPLQGKNELIDKYREKRKKMGSDTVQEVLLDQEWMRYATTKSDYRERVVQAHPVYASMVESLDQNIGRVIDHLKEAGLYDNTLIIFTSDNGGLSTAEGSPTSNLPLRAGKGWLYEGGIRVPFIVKAPGMKGVKGVNDAPVSGVDILPTILNYARIQAVPPGVDGKDLSPLLSGGSFEQRPLFWHYPHYSNQGGNPGSVVRYGNYKLISDIETGGLELYDLKNDLGEQSNLAHKEPETRDKLHRMLQDWLKTVGYRELQPNPDWNGDEPIVN